MSVIRLRTKRTNWFGSIERETKYIFPMIKPYDLGKGRKLIQTSDQVFAVTGLTKVETKKDKRLLSQLMVEAPVDTGTLRRSYNVYPLFSSKTGKWNLVIYNKVWYFKFPYHYYRGEIKNNHRFIRDFVYDAVRKVIL